MDAKEPTYDKEKYTALHGRGTGSSCVNNVHPDVIIDDGEALRGILRRLVRLESEINPIKAENSELKKRNKYLEREYRNAQSWGQGLCRHTLYNRHGKETDSLAIQ